mmetsp:Transcript_12110/g.27232  ORF Transcript_12110/g.27232 Transcript_12110/m.27232 type:complete len:216 (-) Transcript_12110:409-1056(-)
MVSPLRRHTPARICASTTWMRRGWSRRRRMNPCGSCTPRIASSDPDSDEYRHIWDAKKATKRCSGMCSDTALDLTGRREERSEIPAGEVTSHSVHAVIPSARMWCMAARSAGSSRSRSGASGPSRGSRTACIMSLTPASTSESCSITSSNSMKKGEVQWRFSCSMCAVTQRTCGSMPWNLRMTRSHSATTCGFRSTSATTVRWERMLTRSLVMGQ